MQGRSRMDDRSSSGRTVSEQGQEFSSMAYQRRRTERDGLGIPVGDQSSPVICQAREQDERNRNARTAMTAQRMERRLEQIRPDATDRMRREERARHDLEEH